MISTEDLYKELKKHEALAEDDVKEITTLQFMKAVIKLLALGVKLAHNTRTNTVLCMKKLGVEPVKPKAKNEKEETVKG